MAFVCQFHHFILGSGKVEAYIVFKIFYFITPVQFQFYTCIAYLSYVQNWILVTCGRRQAFGYQKVFCLIDVVVDATRQFIVKHTEIETDILCIGSFPFQVIPLNIPRCGARPCVSTLYVSAFVTVIRGYKCLEVIVS